MDHEYLTQESTVLINLNAPLSFGAGEDKNLNNAKGSLNEISGIALLNCLEYTQIDPSMVEFMGNSLLQGSIKPDKILLLSISTIIVSISNA